MEMAFQNFQQNSSKKIPPFSDNEENGQYTGGYIK